MAKCDEEFDLPKGYLSPSAVGMYLRCAKQWEFRYVKGMKSPPGVAMIEGGSYHDAVCDSGRLMLCGKEPLSATALHERFVASFDEKKKEVENWDGEDFDAVVNRAKLVMLRHEMLFQRTCGEVVEVESEVKFEAEGVSILGYIDLIANPDTKNERKPHIIDFKYSNKSLDQDDLRSHIQLGVYSLEKGPKVCIVRNDRKEKGQVQVLTATLTKQEQATVKEVLVGVARGVTSGAFPPCDPSNWCCSPKWCGYWSRCRGKGRKGR
jgi:hypothetical protein